jgi:hypothetical protein
MTPEGHSLRSPVFAGDLGRRRSSTFFNGEVVELDGPLDELTGDALTCDAEEAAA